MMEMETLVTDSMDEPKTQGNIKLEQPVADSIVADSLEVKHDSSSDCDLEPQERKNELMSKVKNVAESLDINDNSQMTMGESLSCEGKEEKAEEQSRLSQHHLKHDLQSSERDSQVKDQDKGYTSNITRPSVQQGAGELPKELHVPAGFLCSRIPRKVWIQCYFNHMLSRATSSSGRLNKIILHIVSGMVHLGITGQ